MLPAPIEKLDEFNVANYLNDLPCGLSIGQAAHEIPKYRSGLIRAVKRTREKETNYVEQFSDEEEQITAAKCEVYIGKEPITAVIDSGAATSIITSSLLEFLGCKINRPSKMVIVTANRTKVKAKGMIDDLPVDLKRISIRSPVHVIDSQDNVLILGNDWLKRSHAVIHYDDETLTIRYKGRIVNLPLNFTTEKSFSIADIEESEEEYETEEELYEYQCYYSDNAYSSDEEGLEYNLWVNEYFLPNTPEPIEAVVDDENPAIYLAEAEIYTNLKEEKLHLGPLVYEQQVSFNNLIEAYVDICAQSQTQIG